MGPLTFVFSTRMGGGGGAKKWSITFLISTRLKMGKVKTISSKSEFFHDRTR